MQSGIIVQMLFLLGGGSAAPQFPNFFNPFGNFPFQQPAFPTFSSSYFPFTGHFPFYNYFSHNPAFNNFPTLPTAAPPPVTEPTEISQEVPEGNDEPVEVDNLVEVTDSNQVPAGSGVVNTIIGTSVGSSGTSGGGGCSFSCVQGVCNNVCQVGTDGVCKTVESPVNNDGGYYNFGPSQANPLAP